MAADPTGESSSKKPRPHYHGHRERLRGRFRSAGPDALADYELLELLLFPVIRRGDVKPVAKDLLNRFGTLAEVLSAPTRELMRIDGIGPESVHFFKVVHAVAQRIARDPVWRRPVLSSWSQVLDYLRVAMAFEREEQFRVLFLDRKNALIADEVQQRGTVDHTPLYPREVVRRALDLGASALILVHNHPSGDPTPSRADVEMTRKVAEAGVPLGIVVHDHIIVAKHGHSSFKSLGLI